MKSDVLKVIKSKLLIVEGKDEENIFNKICEEFNLTSIQVIPIGGKYNFQHTLPILVKDSDFDIVDSIGIVRDADTDADAAFISVCGVLRESRISQPIKPLIPSDQRPITNIFIAAGDNSKGSIESIFMKTVSDQPIMTCVKKYFDCVKEKQNEIPSPDKIDIAKLYVYLSANPNYCRKRFGHSVLGEQWNLKHNELNALINFLKKL